MFSEKAEIIPETLPKTEGDTTIYNVIDNKENKQIKDVIKALNSQDCAKSDIAKCYKQGLLSYDNTSQHRHNSIIPDSTNKSTPKPTYNGQNVRNKSFIVGITDITENNKAKKVDQLEKALTRSPSENGR